MISKQWRERLTYTAMSLFVAWHTLAMLVAPAPESSEIVQKLRPLLQPYLTLFFLDNNWGFYAPGIGPGREFRYVVKDGTGHSHTFVPAAERNWFFPAY